MDKIVYTYTCASHAVAGQILFTSACDNSKDTLQCFGNLERKYKQSVHPRVNTVGLEIESDEIILCYIIFYKREKQALNKIRSNMLNIHFALNVVENVYSE